MSIISLKINACITVGKVSNADLLLRLINFMQKYLYVLGTILFTTYGQLIIKWRMSSIQLQSDNIIQKFFSLAKVIIIDPYVLSGFFAAFIASLCWMSALQKLQLNVAYPMMSISFIMVFILSSFIFHERVSYIQIVGLACILLGVILVTLPSGHLS